MKTDFEIPFDIKNDLVYCQRALTSHILIHQKIASCLSMVKLPEGRLQKSMRLIEKEIMDIGDEQKLLFNRLRFYIDYYQISNNATVSERERLTNYVRDELKSFSNSSNDVKPINVQPRLTEDSLFTKYIRNGSIDDESSYSREYSSANSVSSDVKTEVISGSDEEHMEIMLQPEDNHYEQKVYAGPRQPKTKPKPPKPQNAHDKGMNRAGESLLKPISQRKIEDTESNVIRVVRPEIGIRKVEKPVEELKPQPAAISLGRLRLAEALSKAKNATKTQPTQNPTRDIESPENVPTPLKVKCKSPLSLSQSSNASSSSSSVEIEPMKNELDPADLGQESFLRMFGLGTPAFTDYLMNRRPQRKKRHCTSTERMDFHYGKFELFEKQFSKRNTRQFLYSPPATRAKRRIGSNGSNPQTKEAVVLPKRAKGIKSNASSSSSISSNGSITSEKVCLTCYKRNNLIQCQKCCGHYHAACHIPTTDVAIRKMYCSFCVRQQKLGNNKIATKI